MKTVDLFNLYMGEPRLDPNGQNIKSVALRCVSQMITMPKLLNWLDLQAWSAMGQR